MYMCGWDLTVYSSLIVVEICVFVYLVKGFK